MSTAEVAADSAPIAGLQFDVETPENVVLSYDLAGPAVRLAAFLVDTLIRAGFMLVAIVFLSCAGVSLGLFGIAQGLLLVLWFVMEWCYFAFCEGFFSGRTIGKRSFGLRVISASGTPITFSSAMLRNLVRFADSLPVFGAGFTGIPMYGIGFIVMMFSRNLQRCGDIAAKTVVIRERIVQVPRDPVILERIQPLSRDEIGSFVPDTRLLAVIDDFLGRRSVMSHERGHAMAAIIAAALAEKIDFRGDPELVEDYPMAFLARVHVTYGRLNEEAEDQVRRDRRARRNRDNWEDLSDDDWDDDSDDDRDDDVEVGRRRRAGRKRNRDEDVDDEDLDGDDLFETDVPRRPRRRRY